MIVYGEQQRDSAIHIHVSILPQTSLPALRASLRRGFHCLRNPFTVFEPTGRHPTEKHTIIITQFYFLLLSFLLFLRFEVRLRLVTQFTSKGEEAWHGKSPGIPQLGPQAQSPMQTQGTPFPEAPWFLWVSLCPALGTQHSQKSMSRRGCVQHGFSSSKTLSPAG